MSRIAAIIEAETLGQAPSPTPAPPAPPGTWPNGYTWRSTFRVDSTLLSGALSDVRATISLAGIGALVEELDGADLRVEDDFGNRLPHRLMSYSGGSAVLRVRLPTLSNNSDTIFHVYAGRAGADDEDVAGVYAGLLQAIDTLTGSDLTGQGRDLTPSGLTANFVGIEPAAAFTAGSSLSSLAAAEWTAARAALSIVAYVNADAAITDQNAMVYCVGSDQPAGGPTDSMELGRLAVTSGGVPNVWQTGVVTTSLQTAYTLGSSGTAAEGASLLVSSWAEDQAPDVFVDGLPMSESVNRPRPGLSTLRGDGVYVGAGWVGKIGEILVAPYAYTPERADIEARARLRQLSLWGVGEWHEQDDTAPCIAMPVRAATTAGTTIDIDVLASCIGTGLTLVSVAPGPRGPVVVLAGQARYTATGLQSGTDYFTYTIEDSGGRQSTGRVDLVITSGVDPEPPPPPLEGYLDIPAALSTLTTSDANLAAHTQAAPAGRHLFLPGGTYAGRTVAAPNGTEANPVVWRPLDPDNPPVLTGEWNFTGGIWLTGMDVDGRSIAAGRKSLRFNTGTVNGSTVAYSRIRNGGIGVELNVEKSTRRFRVHRCLFDGAEQPQGTGLNGREPIKIGVNASLIHDLEALIDYCRLKNYTAEAEALKIAGSNVTVYRCHWVNSVRVGVRQGNNCKFIETRTEPGSSYDRGRLTFFGYGHLIRNCASHDLLIWRGNRDPYALTTGGSFWAACQDATVQNHTILGGGVFQINGYPWSSNTSGFTFNASGTRVNNSPTPTLLNGIGAPGAAGSVPVVAAVTLTDSDVGLDAYRTWLAAQP